MELSKKDFPRKESQIASVDSLHYLREQALAMLRSSDLALVRCARTYLYEQRLAEALSDRERAPAWLRSFTIALLRRALRYLYKQRLAEALSDCFESKSRWLGLDDSSKMLKGYVYAGDKKPIGNQGNVSAAGKLKRNAESSGLKDKSIPHSWKDGSSAAEGVSPGNEFEVISAEDIGVTFQDIGGMDDIKKLLQQLVILPYKWPYLFKLGLAKPCRGILLFGPPGAGKTVLAKAIATETGARFIYCSVSTITSNVPGEAGKNVRALFARAAEVAPTIIFIDEVDSMLSTREHGESESMRIFKNEFISSWDGFMTKPGEQILVLGTTSRPSDLDEAAIRRFELRVMVGLPSAKEREEILTIYLSKGKIDGIDIYDLARRTGGYTGSDLEKLCTTAACRPVCEFMLNDLERERKAQEKEKSEECSLAQENNTEKEEEFTIRALTMDDMNAAKRLVAPSFPAEGALMNELNEWKELYGVGGSRNKQRPTYYS